ncbi:MAG: transposase [Sedimentisphaerales bacterium]|nr:transposase [Sedimentisphaerales bacterium]
MPNYRRWYRDGGTYFFTVKTFQRQTFLCGSFARSALRHAIEQTRAKKPFLIVGWALLPDHIHAIWKMPENDEDFSLRWSMIKRLFSQQWLKHQQSNIDRTARMRNKRESGVWQRRFWEHLIRDQTDMAHHMDYIHYNPIKHGLVKCPHEWPHSTFHRWVKAGAYRTNWLCSCKTKQVMRPPFMDSINDAGE